MYRIFYVLLLASFEGVTAQTLRFTTFEKGLEKLAADRRLPSLSVAIAFDDSVVYARAFGYVDMENKLPATTTTSYHIASITKPIAATVMMQLVDEKRLDLNWLVRDHYPDYEKTMARILAYFRQALPEYVFMLDNYHPERTDITLMHHLTHTAEGVPGENYKYNGFLFGNLSKVIEATTGFRFDSMVTKRIIEPLGMEHSTAAQIDVRREVALAGLAKPYMTDSSGKTILSEYQNTDLNAGAGFISTPTDLLAFDKAINRNTLISANAKKFMWEPPVLKNGKVSPYAKGWFVQPLPLLNDTLLWHYGLQPGAFSAIYLKLPSKKMSIVLLSNSDGLTMPDNLGKGDILTSPFIRLFLETYAKAPVK